VTVYLLGAWLPLWKRGSKYDIMQVQTTELEKNNPILSQSRKEKNPHKQADCLYKDSLYY